MKGHFVWFNCGGRPLMYDEGKLVYVDTPEGKAIYTEHMLALAERIRAKVEALRPEAE